MFRIINSQDFVYAEGAVARALRFGALLEFSGRPSLIRAHVCRISARSASETASEARSPRATRLT